MNQSYIDELFASMAKGAAPATTGDAVQLEILKTLKALQASSPEGIEAARRAQFDEFDRECRAIGEAKRKKDLEELRRNPPPPPPPPPPRDPSLGPPCPFVGLPAASLTADQRYAISAWDHPSAAARDKARAVAVPVGELSQAAGVDIARFCAEALVPDEYRTIHPIGMRVMYTSSPGAKITKGASDAAWLAAFAAAGRVPDEAGYFQVRAVADDEGLDFVSAEEEVEPDPQPMIVEGLIPAGCQVVVVGDTTSGKTTLITSMLAAVAHGRPWLGRATLKCQCAIVNFDGRDSDLRQLLQGAGAEGRVSIASYPDDNLASDRFWQALEKRFGSGRPAVIAIDSLSRGNPEIDEKDARFAAPILRAAEISSRYPITFAWIHHSPVKVRGRQLNDWLRGTSALGAAFDIGLGLSKVSAKASPRETIIKVENLKMRPRELAELPDFKLLITDAGIALCESTPKAEGTLPPTDDEQVLAAVVARPGISSGDIEDAVDLRRGLAIEARRRLEAAGLIENRGSSTRRKWFARA